MANTLRNIGLGLARGITADVLGMPVVVFPGEEKKVKILKRE